MNKILIRSGLGLSVALFMCLLPMPYGYYSLIRFAAMIILACMAFCFYQEKKMPLCVLSGSLALLFQPFFKIVLDRTMWNFIDVVVAIGLVILWYMDYRKE